MTIKLEATNCYACGSCSHRRYDSENGYSLVKCNNCGLLYVNPRPREEDICLASQTGKHIGDEVIDVTGSFDESKLPRYRSILSDLFPTGLDVDATWLDIGCGHGEFLASLREASSGRLRLRGCEPNPAKRETAKRMNLDVSFFDLESHEDKYDYVSLLNVYSHLPNPRTTLRRWAELIRPGGKLLLETGHSCHLPASRHHKPYLLPDHLSFANKQIVTRLLEEIGFRICTVCMYRNSALPKVSIPIAARETAKLLLLRNNRFFSMFTSSASRDMYILAARVD